MSDITRKVSKIVPPNERIQSFNQSHASQGDVLMIEDSLGHPARSVTIDAKQAVYIRPNVYHYVYSGIDYGHRLYNCWAPGGKDLIRYGRVKNNEGVSILVDAGTLLELKDDISVSDIEMVITSGNWTITVA